jgi:hypothetical protein
LLNKYKVKSLTSVSRGLEISLKIQAFSGGLVSRELLKGQEGGGIKASYGLKALARGFVLHLYSGEGRGVIEDGVLVGLGLVYKVNKHSAID